MTAEEVKIVDVDSEFMLSRLQSDSAFTIEGIIIDDTTINDMLEWFSDYCILNEFTVYRIKGGLMNKVYHLTGLNAYKDDLTIMSVMLSDLTFKNPDLFEKFCIDRLFIGARWFDDICYNNNQREIKNLGAFESGEDRVYL